MPSSRHSWDTDVSRCAIAAWASFRQRELPAALPSAGSRGLEPGHGAFAGQLPLELGQRREDAEHEAAGHPQACPAGRQVLHGVDQVGEVAAEAVELPDDERPLPQTTRLSARGRA